MEKYRLAIFVVLGLLGLTGYYFQSQRDPEQVMREEKPSSETIITTKSFEQITNALDSVAHMNGMKLHKATRKSRIYNSPPNIFSWCYVIRVDIEEPNDWSRKATIHIYNQAESGYGNRLRRKRRLGKALEQIREKLKSE